MKFRGNQLAMRTLMARALSFSAVAALTLNPVLTSAFAADEPVAAPVGEQAPIVSPVSHRQDRPRYVFWRSASANP